MPSVSLYVPIHPLLRPSQFECGLCQSLLPLFLTKSWNLRLFHHIYCYARLHLTMFQILPQLGAFIFVEILRTIFFVDTIAYRCFSPQISLYDFH